MEPRRKRVCKVGSFLFLVGYRSHVCKEQNTNYYSLINHLRKHQALCPGITGGKNLRKTSKISLSNNCSKSFRKVLEKFTIEFRRKTKLLANATSCSKTEYQLNNLAIAFDWTTGWKIFETYRNFSEIFVVGFRKFTFTIDSSFESGTKFRRFDYSFQSFRNCYDNIILPKVLCPQYNNTTYIIVRTR